MNYALLNDDKTEIVEWPVNSLHIENRGMPLSMFATIKPMPWPSFDANWSYVVEATPILKDGEIHQNWQVVDYPHDQMQQRMMDALAFARYTAETGGIDHNEQRFDTSREAQQRLTFVLAGVNAGIKEVKWKIGTSWVALTGTEFKALATKAIKHVQACFEAEHLVSESITQAKDMDTLKKINPERDFEVAYQMLTETTSPAKKA